MSDIELLKTDDPYMWAKEFCRKNENFTKEYGKSDAFIRMAAWFQGAMETAVLKEKEKIAAMKDKKKLKPVDENCLYKPVLATQCHGYKREKAELRSINPKIGFEVYFWKDRQKSGKCVFQWAEFAERCKDYDYGDGGNYE